MNDLPPKLVELLERARIAHEPTAEELARPLSKLHESLEFAPEVGSSAVGEAPMHDTAVVGGGVLAVRALKGALLTGALGAAVVAGVLWFRARPETASSPPVAHASLPTPAPSASSAVSPAGFVSPAGAREVPTEQTVVAGLPSLAVEARASAPQSSAARSRAGSVRTRGPRGALAAVEPEAPVTAPSESAPVAKASSTSGERDTSAESLAQNRASRTLARPVPSELELIDGALRSLRDRDPARSLALLARHAALYPHGKLATERRALRVLALCAVGDRTNAVHERAAYLADDPHTPMAERVRRTCRPEGEP